jgi:myo-inositol-1(or 4)-monophosphatase
LVAITKFREETWAAIEVVQRALARVREPLGDGAVSAKEGRDIVTSADVAIEDDVRKVLEDRFGLPVIGEERGGTVPANGSPYRLVDPICGTRNFASGTQLYCVNVALIQNYSVVAAIVGDPSRNEILVAESGKGAWSIQGDRRSRLEASAATRTIVVETGNARGDRREAAARFTAAAIRADRWDFRSLGSTLSLAYLAGGRISAYAVFLVTVVHSAAGSLLVTEAGGRVPDISGNPWTLQSDSILATASVELEQELLSLDH